MTLPFDQRPLDVVLFGATGFTGKRVAEYLAQTLEPNLRWAIAGRNREKLEEVRLALASKGKALADLPILVADSQDETALDHLVTQTRVVATTVGPYAKYGMPLARACARQGTSYCDLSGEPTFIRAVIDECHEHAQASHARIVPASGYDSIPSDLGTHIAWDYARRNYGEGLAWAKVFASRMKGAASGGTIASMFGIMDAAKGSREVRRLLFDPHGLDPNPAAAPRDPFEGDQRGVRFDQDLGRWTAPFVMASVNSRVVRRSHALMKADDGGYGRDFRYHEAMSFGHGPSGFAKASAVTAGLGAFFAAAAIPPVRALLERAVLPAPGQGPSQEEIDTGHFEMRIVAQTESGRRLAGRVAGYKDPGYGETAKMIAETAMCLSKDAARLEPRFGVLTPASAMGMRLVERLRAAGMTFEIADA